MRNVGYITMNVMDEAGGGSPSPERGKRKPSKSAGRLGFRLRERGQPVPTKLKSPTGIIEFGAIIW
jgi:hypothetical protein